MPADALVLLQGIAKSVAACVWIHNKCFTAANSAHAQFRALDQDVNSFKNTLVRLESILPAVTRRFGSLKHGRAIHGDGALFMKEAENLFGDFGDTLAQCCIVLEDKKIFRTQRSGPVENLIWNATTEAAVDTMRKRIMFHTMKIELVLHALELASQAQIRERVEDVWQTVMELKDGPRTPLPSLKLEEIPLHALLNIEELFKSTRNRPDWFKGCKKLEDMPLEPAFDTLLFHRQSFEKSRVGTLDRYLHLVKAHWMLCRIKDSDAYLDERAGSLYIVLINDEEHILHDEYADNEYDALKRMLAKEAGPEYLIGERTSINIPSLASTPADGEELLLELFLPSDAALEDSRLIIYRSPKHSFRIVQIVPRREGQSQDTEHPIEINIPKNRIVPKYAFGPSVGKAEVDIYKPNVATPRKLVFQNVEDARAFQRVFTNYEVAHDVGPVRWVIGVTKLMPPFSAKQRFLGRVQIWDWKPFDPTPSVEESLAELTTAGIGGRLETSSLNGHLSNAPSVAATGNSVTSAYLSHLSLLNSSGTNALPVHYKPAIVLFIPDPSKDATRPAYTILYIELKNGMGIVASSCDCKAHPMECHTTVIQNLNHKGLPHRFEVRELSDISQQGRDKPHTGNIGIFGHEPGLGGSRHSQFNDTEVVKVFQAEYLNVVFRTVAERQSFHKQLEEVLDLRDDNERVRCRRMVNHGAVAQRVHQVSQNAVMGSGPMPVRTRQNNERQVAGRPEASMEASSSASSEVNGRVRRRAESGRSPHDSSQHGRR